MSPLPLLQSQPLGLLTATRPPRSTIASPVHARRPPQTARSGTTDHPCVPPGPHAQPPRVPIGLAAGVLMVGGRMAGVAGLGQTGTAYTP